MNHIKYTFLFRNIEMFSYIYHCNDILSIFNGLFGLFFSPIGSRFVGVPFVCWYWHWHVFFFFVSLQLCNIFKQYDKNWKLMCERVCMCFTNHWIIYISHTCMHILIQSENDVTASKKKNVKHSTFVCFRIQMALGKIAQINTNYLWNSEREKQDR